RAPSAAATPTAAGILQSIESMIANHQIAGSLDHPIGSSTIDQITHLPDHPITKLLNSRSPGGRPVDDGRFDSMHGFLDRPGRECAKTDPPWHSTRVADDAVNHVAPADGHSDERHVLGGRGG